MKNNKKAAVAAFFWKLFIVGFSGTWLNKKAPRECRWGTGPIE